MTTRKKCDIVLEGGITSGAVYPGFVCKLAEEYDFQSIGGTSAGGIAAALCAAAQYARNQNASNQDAPDPFKAVAEVPGWLGATSEHGRGTNLFSLFQPSPNTASLFKLATGLLSKGWGAKLEAWASVLWAELLLGALPGVLLVFRAWTPSWWENVLLVLLALFASLCGVAVAVGVSLLARVGRLTQNRFGICSGYAEKTADSPYALVPWLNDRINEIAGKDASKPLTFGDLKSGHVDLRMMTTCFTWGRPFTMPFKSRVFYFCPATFREYFPEEVVAWMEAHPPKPRSTPDDVTPQHSRADDPIDLLGYLPLPDEDDLPVIVAARLSLSFPVLFCAVPLAAIDFSRRRREAGEEDPAGNVPGGSIGHTEPRTPEVVWFTDGGICNNFPIQLFDSPLPLWPTFGIELTSLRPDRPQGEGRAWVPKSNGSAMQPDFKRFPSRPGFLKQFAPIAGVAGGIIDSARNWVNSLQSVVPGYRDRIVRIALTDTEGGLNLNMSAEDVANLSHYGADGAQKLIDHFILGKDNGEDTVMTWENQRWVRYRSAMSLLERYLYSFSNAVRHPEAGDLPYPDLITKGATRVPTHGYPFTADQVPHALAETAAVVSLGASMDGNNLGRGAPKPEPTLVIRPDF